jgi:hypothetical protein
VIRGHSEGTTCLLLPECVLHALQSLSLTHTTLPLQVCLRPEQKDLLDLAAVLRSCASTCVSLLRTGVKRRALDVALLAVRELAWDDHNVPVEPGQWMIVGAAQGPLYTCYP